LILSLESLPGVRDLLTLRAPPKVAVPAPYMPEIAASPALPAPEALPAARPKPAANTAHKRQISESIPRNERPIAREARPEEEDNTDTGEGAGGNEGAGTGIRRSGRARKPKQRS
jgi:hypothetical protein